MRVHKNVLIQSKSEAERHVSIFTDSQLSDNATHTASEQIVLYVLPEVKKKTLEDELENGHVLKTVTQLHFLTPCPQFVDHFFVWTASSIIVKVLLVFKEA